MNRTRITPAPEEQLLLGFPEDPQPVQAELFDFPGIYQCSGGKLRFIHPQPAESVRVGVRDAGSAVQFPGAEVAS